MGKMVVRTERGYDSRRGRPPYRESRVRDSRISLLPSAGEGSGSKTGNSGSNAPYPSNDSGVQAGMHRETVMTFMLGGVMACHDRLAKNT